MWTFKNRDSRHHGFGRVAHVYQKPGVGVEQGPTILASQQPLSDKTISREEPVWLLRFDKRVAATLRTLLRVVELITFSSRRADDVSVPFEKSKYDLRVKWFKIHVLILPLLDKDTTWQYP